MSEANETASKVGRTAGSLDALVVHVDGKPGAQIDSATQAAMDKMAGLLRRKELLRTGNAAVNGQGQIVDIREHPEAVRVPMHNTRISNSDDAPKSS